MDLIGTRVIHKLLGKGKVTQQKEKYIKVEFSDKTCQFQYPEIFRKFLTAEDE